MELRAPLGKLEALSGVSALYDSYSGQSRAPHGFSAEVTACPKALSWSHSCTVLPPGLCHELQLQRSCLYWDLLRVTVLGTFGRRSFKANSLGIPSNLLSSRVWEKHVAKFTAVGFHRKGFSGFLKASLCSLKSGINKSIASEQQRCCLWYFCSSCLISLALDSSYSFTYQSTKYGFKSQFLILLRNQCIVKTH